MTIATHLTIVRKSVGRAEEKVLAHDATIPSLTELLPPEGAVLLNAKDFRPQDVPKTTFSLDAPEGTFHRFVCNTVRGSADMLRLAVDYAITQGAARK